MRTKYEQGRKQQNRRPVELTAGQKLVVGICCLVIVAISVAIILAGCATTPLAKSPIADKAPAAISTTIRVAQMGLDCEKQEDLLKRIISDVFVEQGLPSPDKIELRPLAGSSLCGLVQGMGDELGTPELGARYLAVAEATVYWPAIGYADLRKAQAVLAAMRPLRK